jgi:hypothetical protein
MVTGMEKPVKRRCSATASSSGRLDDVDVVVEPFIVPFDLEHLEDQADDTARIWWALVPPMIVKSVDAHRG